MRVIDCVTGYDSAYEDVIDLTGYGTLIKAVSAVWLEKYDHQ